MLAVTWKKSSLGTAGLTGVAAVEAYGATGPLRTSKLNTGCASPDVIGNIAILNLLVI